MAMFCGMCGGSHQIFDYDACLNNGADKHRIAISKAHTEKMAEQYSENLQKEFKPLFKGENHEHH